jgi:type II secretory pathway pseudopilin PulG
LSAKENSLRISKPHGFTIIEALMLCVLLSIVAMLAMPKMSDYYAETRLRALSKKIVWHLRLCRQLAISRRLTHWVAFDVSGNSYALYEEREDLPGRENRVPLNYLTSEFETDVDIEEDYPGLSLSAVNIGGHNEVGFNLLGSPLDVSGDQLVSDGEVVIEDGDGRERTVSISSQTGKASVE